MTAEDTLTVSSKSKRVTLSCSLSFRLKLGPQFLLKVSFLRALSLSGALLHIWTQPFHHASILFSIFALPGAQIQACSLRFKPTSTKHHRCTIGTKCHAVAQLKCRIYHLCADRHSSKYPLCLRVHTIVRANGRSLYQLLRQWALIKTSIMPMGAYHCLHHRALSIPSFVLAGSQHLITCTNGRISLFAPMGAQISLWRWRALIRILLVPTGAYHYPDSAFSPSIKHHATIWRGWSISHV